MADKLYFAGSIYKRVKRGRGLQEAIARGQNIDGWLMTNYNGTPAIVNDGKLYIFTGKEKGFQSPHWERK